MSRFALASLVLASAISVPAEAEDGAFAPGPDHPSAPQLHLFCPEPVDAEPPASALVLLFSDRDVEALAREIATRTRAPTITVYAAPSQDEGDEQRVLGEVFEDLARLAPCLHGGVPARYATVGIGDGAHDALLEPIPSPRLEWTAAAFVDPALTERDDVDYPPRVDDVWAGAPPAALVLQTHDDPRVERFFRNVLVDRERVRGPVTEAELPEVLATWLSAQLRLTPDAHPPDPVRGVAPSRIREHQGPRVTAARGLTFSGSVSLVGGLGVTRRGLGLTLGLRPEILWPIPARFTPGLYAEATMPHAFDTLELGGGLLVDSSASSFLSITESLGGYVERLDDGWAGGVALSGFIGVRNHDSPYNRPFGLLFSMRLRLDGTHELTMMMGAQLDLLGPLVSAAQRSAR